MYYFKWSAFEQAAIELYSKSPEKTRYCYRWRHDLGHLIIKVTDDEKCIKYRARSAAILNRFDALTRNLMARMQNCTVVPEPAPEPAAQEQKKPQEPAKKPQEGKKKKKGKKK